MLALMFIAGVLSITIPQTTTVKAANTSGTFDERITQLKKKFPAGKYWNHKQGEKNNPDKYTQQSLHPSWKLQQKRNRLQRFLRL